MGQGAGAQAAVLEQKREYATLCVRSCQSRLQAKRLLLPAGAAAAAAAVLEA